MCNLELKVSIITPVYNAASYIEFAVESVIHMPEVGEIILIEDGSNDNSFEICQRLAVNNSNRIQLLQHKGGVNKGAGASRNLGLSAARYSIIAFLDADDLALPNRFQKSLALLQDPEVDGVYEPIGVHYYSPEAKAQFQKRRKLNDTQAANFRTGVRKALHPNDLFLALVTHRHGLMSTDGITLRKSIIEKAGGFDESLRLHQDTHLWIKCAYHGRLLCGSTDQPVALRGVHLENRISKANLQSQSKFYASLWNYFRFLPMPLAYRWALWQRIVAYYPSRPPYQGLGRHIQSFAYALKALPLWWGHKPITVS